MERLSSQMIIFSSTLLLPKCSGVIGGREKRVLQGTREVGFSPFMVAECPGPQASFGGGVKEV